MASDNDNPRHRRPRRLGETDFANAGRRLGSVATDPSQRERPGIGKVRIGLLALAGGILLATIALTYDVVRRPWPNSVYSASADGMVLRIKGQIESGDGSGFALRVAAAVLKMWAGGTDQPLIVELNSGGGDTGAAQMMAYSLLFANLVTAHGTATVVGHESACFSACTFLFAAGKRRNADVTALFMFHQPHTPDLLTGAPMPGKSDWAKRSDWLTGRTLS